MEADAASAAQTTRAPTPTPVDIINSVHGRLTMPAPTTLLTITTTVAAGEETPLSSSTYAGARDIIAIAIANDAFVHYADDCTETSTTERKKYKYKYKIYL
jgi:hypothetical protein